MGCFIRLYACFAGNARLKQRADLALACCLMRAIGRHHPLRCPKDFEDYSAGTALLNLPP